MIPEALGYEQLTSGPLLINKGEQPWEWCWFLVYEEDNGGPMKKYGMGQDDHKQNNWSGPTAT